jgi:hypothetical protein
VVCVALFLVWGYGKYVGDVVGLGYDVCICLESLLLGKRCCHVELGKAPENSGSVAQCVDVSLDHFFSNSGV